MSKKNNNKEKKRKKEGPNKLMLLIYLWKGGLYLPDEDGNNRIVQDFIAGLFALFAWTLLFSTIIIFAAVIYASVAVIKWSPKTISNNIVGIVLTIVLLMFSSTAALILKVMSNDVKNEKDRHYVIALFSSMVGFLALIISVIALFKGVG